MRPITSSNEIITEAHGRTFYCTLRGFGRSRSDLIFNLNAYEATSSRRRWSVPDQTDMWRYQGTTTLTTTYCREGVEGHFIFHDSSRAVKPWRGVTADSGALQGVPYSYLLDFTLPKVSASTNLSKQSSV